MNKNTILTFTNFPCYISCCFPCDCECVGISCFLCDCECVWLCSARVEVRVSLCTASFFLQCGFQKLIRVAQQARLPPEPSSPATSEGYRNSSS